MKVNSISNTAFRGALNNKLLLGALEKISDRSATFCTATAVLASVVLRPIAISAAPKVQKENKEHSIASSISSGAVKFLTASLVSIPVENIVKNIEKNPQKYLKTSLNNFLENKKNFDFASQILKQSANLITAIPKSIITISLIPIIMDKIFRQKPKKEAENNISFKGNIKETASKLISKYFNNESIQNFANKNSKNAKNVTRNMSALTDVLLTGSFIFNAKKSRKIDKERKDNLIYNSIISTGMALLAGFGLDNIIQKHQKGFIEKFIQLNKDNPKLSKYIQGINVVRPAIIFAFVYYGILPIVSNFIAQKISDKNCSNSN